MEIGKRARRKRNETTKETKYERYGMLSIPIRESNTFSPPLNGVILSLTPAEG